MGLNIFRVPQKPNLRFRLLSEHLLLRNLFHSSSKLNLPTGNGLQVANTSRMTKDSQQVMSFVRSGENCKCLDNMTVTEIGGSPRVW